MNVKNIFTSFLLFCFRKQIFPKAYVTFTWKRHLCTYLPTHVMCAACRKRLRAIWHAVKPAGHFALLMGENLTNCSSAS
uniref:Uncharacterized protein n=1 Tax=Arundo donax TaxID=35708 RepID=A0A0A9HGH2_ARUDO